MTTTPNGRISGLHGILLDVDLTRGSIGQYPIPEAWQRKYLGGRGLGTRVLLEEQPAGVPSFNRDNNLVFMTGPLTGLGVPGASRHWVGSRSPLTGSLGESYAGGRFGHELARTGFDGIIVRGRAETLTTLRVTNGDAQLEDATELWGATTTECTEILAGDEGSCASIGPAGEHFAKLAAIINDRNHAAGGRGLGAVMGSKRLKAVVVKGDLQPPVANQELFETRRRAFASSLRDNDRLMKWGRFGTSSAVEILNERRMLPTKNFRRDRFEEADQIGAVALQDMVIQREGCGNCPVKCKHVVSGAFEDEIIESGGPEYETLAAFGSLVLNDNIAAITLANQRCNEYGLDTIGVGHAIAAAMEADTPFEWGDPRTILDLIDRIAYREGIGEVLADGPAAAERYLDLEDGVATIKGAPVGLHDVMKKRGMGLSAAVSPRGATHTEGFDDTLTETNGIESDLPIDEQFHLTETQGKPRAVVVFENARSFVNSLVMCSHVVQHTGHSRNYDELRGLIESVVGRELTIDETLTVGERNYNLGKLFALREGFDVENDKLPKRLRKPLDNPGVPDMPTQTFSEGELNRMKMEYYDLRGWTNDGISRSKLRNLGLNEFADVSSNSKRSANQV